MARRQRLSLFERLKNGLEEGIAHARGEEQLPEKKVSLPLPPQPRDYDPEDIRALRTRLRLRQAEFSQIFLVSVKTVQSWEQGTRSPSKAATRLLQVLEDPGALESLHELASR